MIKKLFIALVMSCFMVGSAFAFETTKFDDMYDKDPECFMTLDYYDLKSGGVTVRVVQGGSDVKTGRTYFQEDGSLWDVDRSGNDVAVPCCTTGTVPPSWICPAVVVVTPAIEAVSKEQKNFVVYFGFDKSDLTYDSLVVLRDAVEYAKSGGFSTITLAAYCDFRGTEEYNVGLGQRRLDSVHSWITSNISGVEFELTNNGESLSPVRDLVDGRCEGCWEDRRVDIGMK